MKKLHLLFMFLIIAVAPLVALAQSDDNSARMIILGVDGMDPTMLAEFMRDGDTPNLKKLAEQGGFMKRLTRVFRQAPGNRP